MTVLSQTSQPKIEFISYSTFAVYETFSPKYNTTLQSYSFDKSVENLIGSFSLTIKDSAKSFMDMVTPLDIVKFYEDSDNKVSFIGIVTGISFGATAGTGQKVLSISGKSIEYLFDLFRISVDVTAMSFFNKEVKNIQFKVDLATSSDEALSIKNLISKAWSAYKNALSSNQGMGISAYKIGEILEHFYSSNMFQVDNIDALYPISSNLFSNAEIKFMDYVRNLLPQNVYEIYGKIDDFNRPYIKIREIPFDSVAWDKNGNVYQIPAYLITDYTFSRTNEEVYTAFLSYLEGSSLSSDFYQKITASQQGYTTGRVSEEKKSLYGYRCLKANFVGYNSTNNDEDKDTKEQKLTKKLTDLNSKLEEWYGHLDDMYTGDVTIINYHNFPKPGIGDRVKICGGEFYVKNEKHTWKYGDSPMINYTLDRGGKYVNGKFSKLTGISKPFAELLG